MNISGFIITITGLLAYMAYKSGALASFAPAQGLSYAPDGGAGGGGDLAASLLQNTALAPPGSGGGVSAADLDAAVRTILGEDDTSAAGMTAVANTIWNRATNPASEWFGQSLTDIVTAGGGRQFNAWLPGTADYNRIMGISPASSLYQQALSIMRGVIDGTISDNTGGALYYRVEPYSPGYSTAVNNFFASLLPTVRIGNQQYYTLGG